MRLLACCLIFLLVHVQLGFAVDWDSIPLNNRGNVRPVTAKVFLDALASEYQRVDGLPANQHPAASTTKRGMIVQRAAFAVILSAGERQNNPQKAGHLGVRFVVERYVQDVLGEQPSTNPTIQAQQSDDCADFLLSLNAEMDRIGEYSSLPSVATPKAMNDIVAAQLASTELTARSTNNNNAGPPTFPRIETTRQYTQAMDQLIDRYDAEVASAEHLPGYRSEKSQGMSLFERTSQAVNALPDGDKAGAQRANGLYDIAQVPATAMPLDEYDDRRDDEQEQEDQP